MHIVHLALVADVLTSVLLDLSDHGRWVAGPSRESRLDALWQSYRSWAERTDVPDRIERRLFTKGFLRTSKYPEVSQKIMNATAARYCTLWLRFALRSILQSLGDTAPGTHLLWMVGVCDALAEMEELMASHGCLATKHYVCSQTFGFHAEFRV